MMKVKNYVCPECGKIFKTLNGWSSHMEEKHNDTIPTGFTLARYFYYLQTGKDHGTCVICKRESDWNEESMKYNRFCNDPDCKKEYRKRFEKNCIDKNGYVHKLNDPEVQRMMLSKRRISGKYTFENSTGDPKEYVGKDELAFLEMLDMIGWDANDIMAPSPHTYEYDYKNPKDKDNEGKHFYIPDFYIPSINCEVECKDTSNNHHKIKDIDQVKDKCKREAMSKNRMVNYVFIDRKDFTPFFDLLFEIKRTFLNKEIEDKRPGNTMRVIDKIANESFISNKNDRIVDEEAINRLRNSLYRKSTKPAIESLFLSKGDKEINVNLWGTSPENNILWVTGFSGSGKSTLAQSYGYKYEDVYTISLDHFFELHNGGVDMKKEVPKYYDWIYPRIKSECTRVWNCNRSDRKAFSKALDDLIDKIIRCSKEDFGKRRYVIEGIQVYDFIPYEVIKGQPLVIKGTSALKSFKQKAKRDGMKVFSRTRSIKDNFKSASEYIQWYLISNKQLKTLEEKGRNN